jgi:hypothetical protein
MNGNDKLDACSRCGEKLGRHDENKQMSMRGRWVCDVCYRQLAHPAHPKLLEQLEEMIDRYGLKRMVQALVNIGHEKALNLLVNWQDEPAARSWKRDAGRLVRVEGKLEN